MEFSERAIVFLVKPDLTLNISLLFLKLLTTSNYFF
jgi:hypothetical protein